MSDLAELLDTQLSSGMTDFDPEVLSVPTGGLVAPSLGRTESITELAELIAGTSDKRTRAYKSARRNVERWSPSQRLIARGVKPRRPRETSLRRLSSARRQQNEWLRRLKLHGGEMRVRVSWYGTRKPEWLPPGRWIHIRQNVMRRVVREWADGDVAEAARTLFRVFLGQYNVPNVDDWLRDAEVVELVLEPSGGAR